MTIKIGCRIVVIYFMIQFFIFNKAQCQESQGQKYKREVEDAARRESEKEKAIYRSQKRAGESTDPGKNGSNKTVSSNIDGINNDKEINELLEFYRKGALELRQAASNCINTIEAYKEVRFISPDSRVSTNYTAKKLQIVNQWSKEQLITGYLLKTKNKDKWVVAVWRATNYEKGWGLYLVSCLTDKTNFSSPVSYNFGNGWSEIKNLLNVGSFTYFSSELEAIDKAIPIELKRTADEEQKIIDRAKADAEARNEQAKKESEQYRLKYTGIIKTVKEQKLYTPFSIENVAGIKLDIKAYKPGNDEGYVTFFFAEESTQRGKLYKFRVDKYNETIYSFYNVAEFDNLLPDDLKNDQTLSATRLKRIERLASVTLNLVSDETNNRLKAEEESALEQRRSQIRADKNRVIKAEAIFSSTSGSGTSYTGDIVKGKKYGPGISTEANKKFSGFFVDDKTRFGVESGSDGTTVIYINPYQSYISSSFFLNMDGDIRFSYTFMGMKGPFSKSYLSTPNGDLIRDPAYDNYSESHIGFRLFSNGDIYRGNFNEGVFEGYGAYLEAAGAMYKGKFHKGKRHGEGVIYDTDSRHNKIYYKNGNLIERKVEQADIDEQHYGITNYPDRKVYQGERDGYYDGTPLGIGILKLPNGDICQGFFNIPQMNFEGIIRLKDGRIINGIFDMNYGANRNFTISCKKEESYLYLIKYPDNSFYYGKISGSFQKNGPGNFYSGNGDLYVGSFNNDVRNAADGTLVYKNGDVFNGHFVNGQIEGQGQYLDAAKKEKYSGHFKNGIREGEGTIYFADGTSKEVKYMNGVLQQ